jgi:hypothetical protein
MSGLDSPRGPLTDWSRDGIQPASRPTYNQAQVERIVEYIALTQVSVADAIEALEYELERLG